MRSAREWMAAVILAGVCGTAGADSLDINLHDKALRATYGHNVGRGLELDVGHFFDENDNRVTHAGLHVSGENWTNKGIFDVGLGGRLVYVDTKDADASALAIGARVRFSPAPRVGVSGRFYYAPQIITTMDGKNYVETSLSADYHLLPQGFVYVGYRRFDVGFDVIDQSVLDDQIHLGMKLLF